MADTAEDFLDEIRNADDMDVLTIHIPVAWKWDADSLVAMVRPLAAEAAERQIRLKHPQAGGTR